MYNLTSVAIGCVLSVVLTSNANAQAFQGRVENSFLFFDTCNNEDVAVNVEIHLVMTDQGLTINNVKGVAVGLTSGTWYEWNGTAQFESVEIVDGNTVTSLLTGVGRNRLISHGHNPNLLVTTYFEMGLVITLDPVTGFPIDFEPFDNSIEVIDCRGAHY